MLCGIYLGSALMAAILLAIFLTNIKKEGKNEGSISSFRLFVATAHHLRNPKQILLIPLTIFSGVEQAYIASDYGSTVILQAFVNCALGIHNVGNVMIAYGVADAICSFGFGYLMKYVGRTALFLLAASINICLIITMFTWTVNSESVLVFYAIAALWGTADAVWQTQINGKSYSFPICVSFCSSVRCPVPERGRSGVFQL